MISLGPMGSTMKMCVNMEITAKFNTAFNKISKYKIENMKLSFFDETGNELLRFKKVD
jgi:heat shock protein HslJ